MSRSDRQKWEARYRQRTALEIGTADPFLPEILEKLPTRGTALDLAGGSGRHSLLLAQRGLAVTLVDVSPAGLALAEAAAAAVGVSITTQALDLDVDPLPEGPFVVVFCSWYLPAIARWQEIHQVLQPEGLLVLVHPTIHNLEKHAHPSARFCVIEEDLRGLLADAGFQVQAWTSGWDSAGKHTLRVVAQAQTRALS